MNLHRYGWQTTQQRNRQHHRRTMLAYIAVGALSVVLVLYAVAIGAAIH